MGGISDIEWREALYRQLARQPGLPPGLRPELIKSAERCVDRSGPDSPMFFAASSGDGAIRG